MRINVNINEMVVIKLTPSGRQVYAKYLSQFNSPYINQNFEDVLEMPLWEVAQIFGSELYMGNTNAPFFEENAIEFKNIEIPEAQFLS